MDQNLKVSSKAEMAMLLMFSNRLNLMQDELNWAFKTDLINSNDYSILKAKFQSLINDLHMIRTKLDTGK